MTIDNFSKDANAFFANCDASVIIGCGETMEKLIELDALCRKHKRRLIAVKVYGASGFVFNDLSDHEILDVDGETYKEVSLLVVVSTQVLFIMWFDRCQSLIVWQWIMRISMS